MSSVNKVILVGNLGKDPETRYTQNSQKIVHLSVATSERWRNRDSGEMQERTEWHNVVIFNEHLADIAENLLRKGSKVYIEGSIQTRKWQDQKGQDRWTTEIVLGRYKGEVVLLSGGASDDDASRPKPVPARRAALSHSGTQQQEMAKQRDFDAELDDDIPF